MRHKIGKRGLLVLVMCLACVLAWGATLAWADGAAGNNTLVVGIGTSEEDVKNANNAVENEEPGLYVNLYRIARFDKNPSYDTYDYHFEEGSVFESLKDSYEQLATSEGGSVSPEQWDSVADAAKTIVQPSDANPSGVQPDARAKLDVTTMKWTLDGLADGIYLVLVPDEPKSSLNTYNFTAALVALPGKVGADASPVLNTWEGTWTNATDPVTPVQVNLKCEPSQRFGSLEIIKAIKDFSGDPVTLAFRVVDTETMGQKFDVVVGIQYSEESKSVIVNGIPAGMNVTVTEEYSGAQYILASANDVSVTISADTTIPVSFTNEPNDSGSGGHGIVNHFTYNSESGEWPLNVIVTNDNEVAKEHLKSWEESDAA